MHIFSCVQVNICKSRVIAHGLIELYGVLWVLKKLDQLDGSFEYP